MNKRIKKKQALETEIATLLFSFPHTQTMHHLAAKDTLRRLPASNSNPFRALSAAAESSSV